MAKFQTVHVMALPIALEIDTDTPEGAVLSVGFDGPEADLIFAALLDAALDLTHAEGAGIRFSPYIEEPTTADA